MLTGRPEGESGTVWPPPYPDKGCVTRDPNKKVKENSQENYPKNVKRIFYRKGLERRWFDGHFHRRASACTAVGIVTTAKTIVVVMITPV
jgi:hypothetical protein